MLKLFQPPDPDLLGRIRIFFTGSGSLRGKFVKAGEKILYGKELLNSKYKKLKFNLNNGLKK